MSFDNRLLSRIYPNNLTCLVLSPLPMAVRMIMVSVMLRPIISTMPWPSMARSIIIMFPVITTTGSSVPCFAILIFLKRIITSIASFFVRSMILHFFHSTSIYLLVVCIEMPLTFFSSIIVNLSV